MRVDLEHVMAHPPERVFAVLSDPARRPEWQESTSDVVVLTPGPPAIGTRWREIGAGIGVIEAEVVGFVPGELWEETGSADGGEGRITVRLRPEGAGGTHVSMTVELHLKGLRRVMEGALQPIVARRMPQDLERLDALLAAAPG